MIMGRMGVGGGEGYRWVGDGQWMTNFSEKAGALEQMWRTWLSRGMGHFLLPLTLLSQASPWSSPPPLGICKHCFSQDPSFSLLFSLVTSSITVTILELLIPLKSPSPAQMSPCPRCRLGVCPTAAWISSPGCSQTLVCWS